MTPARPVAQEPKGDTQVRVRVVVRLAGSKRPLEGRSCSLDCHLREFPGASNEATSWPRSTNSVRLKPLASRAVASASAVRDHAVDDPVGQGLLGAHVGVALLRERVPDQREVVVVGKREL